MLSMEDIGAMKMNAILNSGSRLKDFTDMYFLLEKIPLATITSCFVQKYPQVNTQMAHAALLYHEDINTKERIDFLDRNVTLDQMVLRFKTVIQNPSLIIKSEIKQSLAQDNKIADKMQKKLRNKPRL